MNSSSFWSDPKVYISLLAILISLAAFLFTLANQSEQNRRWDKLNSGNAILQKLEFRTLRMVKASEINTTDWGHQAFFNDIQGDTSNYIMLYCLEIIDPILTQGHPPLKMCFTIKDLFKEMQQVGIKTDISKIARAMKPILTIKNVGKTDLKKVIVTFFIQEDNTWSQMPPIDQQVTLAPEGILRIPITIFFSLNGPMPDLINCKVKIQYEDVNGNKISKFEMRHWESKTNEWTYLGSGEE